jgi:hypothetical protein
VWFYGDEVAHDGTGTHMALYVTHNILIHTHRTKCCNEMVRTPVTYNRNLVLTKVLGCFAQSPGKCFGSTLPPEGHL